MALLKYTNIQHVWRRKNGLSCNEYVICDMVHHLSRSEKSKVPGWCYMSRQNMADELGITRRGLQKMVDRLSENGYLIKNEVTKHLKTTETWEETYIIRSEQSSPRGNKEGEQSSHQGSEQSSPNNNSSNNTNKMVFKEPDKKEFLDYCKTLDPYKPELDFSLSAKYDQWKDNNWVNGNKKKIKNWKLAIRNTIPFLRPVYQKSMNFNDQETGRYITENISEFDYGKQGQKN